MSVEQLAGQAEVAVSTINRIESGKMGAKLATLKTIMDVLKVPDDRREVIRSLARHATTAAWWQPYTGDGVLPDWFELYVDLEEEASDLAIFDPQYVNGLVQTENYAREMYRIGRRDDPDDTIERLVAVRMERQRRLVDGGMSLRLIMDESVLGKQFGGRDVMRAQLQRLLDLADLRRVEMQLLPTEGQPGIIGGFHMLDFPDPNDPPVVYIEHEAGAWYLEKPPQIHAYARAYDRLRAAALSPQASVAHVAQLVKEL
ncbi:transcriptional regulator [Actinocatenispora thailandica]|uniref:Transcriptional regulator n=2 Tax=Actinocatenispora thailandica TaxID=227318 RepID=A0A7R7DWS3_9ACTN|nr:transcriptional regulator [Actinocatenispora thailandica]